MRPALGLVLVFGLSLSACGSSPKTQFFALEPVPPSGPARQVEGLPLSVNAVRLPPILDRLELVALGSSNAVEVKQESRWAAPLDRMSRDVLARDLAERLPSGMVVAPDAPKPVGPLRGLVVDLAVFAPDASGRVTLDGNWVVMAGTPAIPRRRQHEHIETGGAGEGQASAMSDALAQLADRVADQLAKPLPRQGSDRR